MTCESQPRRRSSKSFDHLYSLPTSPCCSRGAPSSLCCSLLPAVDGAKLERFAATTEYTTQASAVGALASSSTLWPCAGVERDHFQKVLDERGTLYVCPFSPSTCHSLLLACHHRHLFQHWYSRAFVVPSLTRWRSRPGRIAASNHPWLRSSSVLDRSLAHPSIASDSRKLPKRLASFWQRALSPPRLDAKYKERAENAGNS